MMTGFDFSTVFGNVQTQVTDGITSVAPIAVALGGLILAIGVGWKLVKRFTGR